LNRKYGDTEPIVRQLRTQLLSIPKCSNLNDVKKFQNTYELLLRQLQAHGKQVQSDEIHQFLESRLPYHYLERIWAAKKEALEKPNGKWGLDEFRKKMEEILHNEDQLSRVSSPFLSGNRNLEKSPASGYPRSGGPHVPPHRVAFANMNFVKPYKQVGTYKGCLFCHGDHPANFCRLPVREKIQVMQKLRNCFKCLAPGHSNKQCKAECCRNCKGDHHTFLCTKENRPPVKNTYQANPMKGRPNIPTPNYQPINSSKPIPSSEQPNPSIETRNTMIATSASATSICSTQALMMCPIATVFNPYNFKHIEVPIFLDSGSSES